ncbi:hypothetical protein NS274_12805 [Pseudomonas oryzihabitans]|nr:hypothetical protein NS274_12805 [Pseudomonas psychrotolerans]
MVRVTARYAELHCLSNFSFQRGASSVDQLFERAKAMGYEALAITDECTLAGIVRAWQASEKHDVRLIVGAEFKVAQGPKLVLLVEDLLGYQHLCRLITLARRRADKGSYRLLREDLDQLTGLIALWVPNRGAEAAAARWLKDVFPGQLWIAAELHFDQDDQVRLQELRKLGETLELPLVATGDVHMHCRGRRALQDTITAIRHYVPVAEAGQLLFPNGERHLRTLDALERCYPPPLLEETLRIAERCRFSLDELHYQYPSEVVPEGHTATTWLRVLTEEGCAWRWPEGLSPRLHEQIEKELQLIADRVRIAAIKLASSRTARLSPALASTRAATGLGARVMPLTVHVPDLVYPSGLNPWQSAYIFALVFLRIPTASLPNPSRTSPDIVKQSA